MNALRPHRALIFAVLGGVCFALTSPPTDLYPAVIVGLALLAASLGDAPTVLRAFGRAAAWGTAAGIVGLRFVPEVIQRFTSLGDAASYLSLVLLAAGQSLTWAFGALITHVLHRRGRVPFELSFASGVFVAVTIPTVFAWTPAGLVSPWPVFVQLADVVGECGVSALFALAAALFARAGLYAAGIGIHGEPVSPPRKVILAPLVAATFLLATLGIHGAARMSEIDEASASLPTLRVSLVNQGVGPLDRWDPKNHKSILATLKKLTKEAESEGVDLTVWPEAAYPYALNHDAERAPRGLRSIVGGGVKGPVLTGLITRALPIAVAPGVIESNSFNSATIVSRSGAMQPSYDKLQLLWFGETVPGASYFPWLRRIFQKSGGLIPGAQPRGLTLDRPGEGPVTLGVLNCYEDTLANVGGRIARAISPDLLVNVTNDAWFVGTAEPELHARLAVMRAVELRRDLVRSVNLGVTSWVDAAGTVRARNDAAEPFQMIARPAIRETDLTFYGRFGDAPMGLLLLLVSTGFAIRAGQAAAKEEEGSDSAAS